MTWVKFDDRAFNNQTFGSVSRDARLLHLEALAWSMADDGTGRVTRFGLRRATDAADPDALAAELVAAGLWSSSEDGWQLVYLLEDQQGPEEIARQREFNRERQKRRRHHLSGDHSLCDPRSCSSATHAATHGATTTVSSSPCPDLTRPRGRRSRAEGSTGSKEPTKKNGSPVPVSDLVAGVAMCPGCHRLVMDGEPGVVVVDNRGHLGHRVCPPLEPEERHQDAPEVTQTPAHGATTTQED